MTLYNSRRHDLRNRVRDEILIGATIGIPSPVVVEALSSGPFPVLCIDAEHSPLSLDRLEGMLRAADVGPVPAMVRVPEVGSYIARVLDLGAAGIVVPRIESVAEAVDVVARARYAPEGRRGAGPGRGQGYGASLATHVARANAEVLVAIQIETSAGLAVADQILAVPGIDAVVIGPFDLATSLGVPMWSDEHVAAIDAIFAAGDAHGVAKGAFVLTPEEMPRYRKAGATLLFAGIDLGWIVEGARRTWEEVNG
ncbi:HpcH/HpaI aldolase/citrate lyase family protein [Pseudonocardia yuanmonensis]|uniref:HpcH/HpaI aldolase/citrate lyase family protein n=1 Tax=Pseudonocardia yuanmonensis TaxID=1095914 RepID=A0ABP8XPW1_9PSEU